MKLKLVEIRPMIDVLPGVIDADKLPTKTGYWLGRALVDLIKEHAPYEEARRKIIVQHAKTDDEGEFVTREQGEDMVHVFDDIDAFEAAIKEIADEEIDIKYEPVTIDAFGDSQIKGTVLLKLGRLIKDDDEDIPPLTVVE